MTQGKLPRPTGTLKIKHIRPWSVRKRLWKEAITRIVRKVTRQ